MKNYIYYSWQEIDVGRHIHARGGEIYVRSSCLTASLGDWCTLCAHVVCLYVRVREAVIWSKARNYLTPTMIRCYVAIFLRVGEMMDMLQSTRKTVLVTSAGYTTYIGLCHVCCLSFVLLLFCTKRMEWWTHTHTQALQ